MDDRSNEVNDLTHRLATLLRVATADALARQLIVEAALRRLDRMGEGADARLRWILETELRGDLTPDQHRARAAANGETW